MSALGQKQTHAAQQKWSLFDHLVGASEHRVRHGETKRLGRLQINRQIVLGWRLHRQVGRLLALENTIDVVSRAPVLVSSRRADDPVQARARLAPHKQSTSLKSGNK
jgi:hypothetical protein